MNFNEQYEIYKSQIDAALDGYLRPDGFPFDGLLESMRYSLLSGGKRVRPILTLAFAQAVAGMVEEAMPAACALEMLHTYSLIHDDLPCMDDDDLRRGKPTNHKVFGECSAVLAGDALQAEAFNTLLGGALPPERALFCARYLAAAAGTDGICGGQYMDMAADGMELDDDFLFDLINRKTGALFVAACAMGVAAAGGTGDQEEAACRYGAVLGIAFQIRDDLLDAKEENRGNRTLYKALGKEKCERFIEDMTKLAKDIVSEHFAGFEFLRAIAETLAKREN